MTSIEVLSELNCDHLSLVNSVLRDLGHVPIPENDCFEIESESIRSHFLKVRTKGSRSCPIVIYLEEDSLRIDIAEINEAVEFTAADIDQRPNDLKGFLRVLFTSFIVIEYKISPQWRSRAYFFDGSGKCVLKMKLCGILNIFSEWEFERILYTPLLTRPVASEISSTSCNEFDVK